MEEGLNLSAVPAPSAESLPACPKCGVANVVGDVCPACGFNVHEPLRPKPFDNYQPTSPEEPADFDLNNAGIFKVEKPVSVDPNPEGIYRLVNGLPAEKVIPRPAEAVSEQSGAVLESEQEEKKRMIKEAPNFTTLFKAFDEIGLITNPDGETYSPEKLKDAIRKIFTEESRIDNITRALGIRDKVRSLFFGKGINLGPR